MGKELEHSKEIFWTLSKISLVDRKNIGNVLQNTFEASMRIHCKIVNLILAKFLINNDDTVSLDIQQFGLMSAYISYFDELIAC